MRAFFFDQGDVNGDSDVASLKARSIGAQPFGQGSLPAWCSWRWK